MMPLICCLLSVLIHDRDLDASLHGFKFDEGNITKLTKTFTYTDVDGRRSKGIVDLTSRSPFEDTSELYFKKIFFIILQILSQFISSTSLFVLWLSSCCYAQSGSGVLRPAVTIFFLTCSQCHQPP